MRAPSRLTPACAVVLALLASPPAAPEDEAAAAARLVAELGLRESAVALRDRPGWSAPRKVLLMGAEPARVAWMRDAAPGVVLVGTQDRAAAVREAADADAVIGECVPEVIAAGPRIRWVQRMYAGVERCLAIPAFAERGIVLTNMQKVAGPVMAEHVLALMLGLTRGLAGYVPAQARGEWADEAVPESRLWEVRGRTMLVVGLPVLLVEAYQGRRRDLLAPARLDRVRFTLVGALLLVAIYARFWGTQHRFIYFQF